MNEQPKVIEMIQDVKSVFLEHVEELDWMDEDTKLQAKIKVRHVRSHF